MQIKYITISRRRDILPAIKDITRYFTTVASLIPIGEPLPLTGNHIVIRYKAPFGVQLKIDGQKEIIYVIRYIIDLIIDGKLKEHDYMEIQKIAVTY